MFKHTIRDIKWDTDGEDAKLPSEVVVEDEERLGEDELSDCLTDAYGYCHGGFVYEVEGEPEKPTLTATVEIPKKTLDWCEKMLKSGGVDYGEEKIPELTALETWTAGFEDGFFAVLKFNSNTREDADFFAEAVLLDSEGRQVDFSETEYELLGEWRLESRDKTYIVDVVEGN